MLNRPLLTVITIIVFAVLTLIAWPNLRHAIMAPIRRLKLLQPPPPTAMVLGMAAMAAAGAERYWPEAGLLLLAAVAWHIGAVLYHR